MSVKSKIDPSKLHVVTCISNPVRYESRYNLYNRFAKEMKAVDANLLTVEAAFGERIHEITPPLHGNHLQLRGSHELWIKENMLNLGIQHLPEDWQYVAWVDGDISFLRPDWQEETLEALQHYPVVQMFESAVDQGPTGEVIGVYSGFGAAFAKGLPMKVNDTDYGTYGTFRHPGFAWAARREAFNSLGGLIDKAILGAGDHHAALALIGQAEKSLPGGISEGYRQMVMEWQERAKADRIIGNLGYVPGSIAHHWHGSKAKRYYIERWGILTKYNYDPNKDVKRDYQGLLQFTAAGERMRNEIRRYMRARNEDGIDE